MKDLMTAIYTKFSALPNNTFYTSINGRLYFSILPQDVTYPCASYHLVTDTHSYTFREKFEEALIQINLFSKSSSSTEVTTMYENLKDLFDWCTLSVTGYRFFKMSRDFAILEWDPDTQIWMYIVQYRIFLQES